MKLVSGVELTHITVMEANYLVNTFICAFNLSVSISVYTNVISVLTQNSVDCLLDLFRRHVIRQEGLFIITFFILAKTAIPVFRMMST